MIVFQQSPTITEGNRTTVDTTDSENESLMSQVLKELKKMNIHMSLVTDSDIKNTEVE